MKRLPLVLLGITLLLAGCDTRGYAFKVDESIDMTAPKARSTVRLPVTVTWTDERAPASYGVFVDRAPIGAGRELRSIVGKEDSCRRTPNCPDEAYLRERGIIVTTTPSVTLDLLRDLRASKRGSSKDPHEVIVVRMRGDRRVGEASFRLNFFVDRD